MGLEPSGSNCLSSEKPEKNGPSIVGPGWRLPWPPRRDAKTDHRPGWETEAHGGQVTCPGPLSRGIPQHQDLPLCRSHAPSCLVHTVCTPAVCQQSLLPLTSSRNQEPELVFGAGRSCRLQTGQEKPLKGAGIRAKSCRMRGSQSCEGRKRVS